MDWETLYCSNQHCRYYGVPFPQSRLVRNGTYRGQAQGLCQACHRSISLRYGTAYFGLESDPAVFETAVRALTEGNSIRATLPVGHAVSMAKPPRHGMSTGTGTPRKWKLVTPAMAADTTDHVWTTPELLSYRLPLHFLETLSKMEHLFPSLEQVNQGK